MPIYCFSHYFIDISMITVFKQFFYCIFSSPFMIILLVRFYIQKSFQQVKAKYLDFKTKKQLLAIHLVIQLEITKLWLYLLLLDTKSDIKHEIKVIHTLRVIVKKVIAKSCQLFLKKKTTSSQMFDRVGNWSLFNTLSANSKNGLTHSTIRRQQPTNCLSVFDHFVGLAIKQLKYQYYFQFKIEQEKLKVFVPKFQQLISFRFSSIYSIKSLRRLLLQFIWP